MAGSGAGASGRGTLPPDARGSGAQRTSMGWLATVEYDLPVR